MNTGSFSDREALASEQVPALPGVPFLGVLPKIGRDPLNFFLNAAAYHPVVRLDMGNRRLILISEPDHVKYVLQDNNRNYHKGYGMVKPLLGEGLVTSDGELWLRQRRLMQPAFSKPELVVLSSTMIQLTKEMIDRWRKRSELQEPLDIANEMMALTQAIIVRTMFGMDIGEDSATVSQAFRTTLEFFQTLMMSPLAQFYRLPTPANRRFRRAVSVLEEVIYKIIASRRKSGDVKADLLGMLLSAKNEETGEGMSDRQIRDEVMTIFLAGHETTATLLAWTWYLLSKDPTVDRRVRAEIEQTLAGREPTFDDLPKLTYTSMVLDEALRIYPPVWMFARQAVEDDSIGGYTIPAGAMLMLSPYVSHRLGSHWDNPEGFDPERFSPERSALRPRFAYFPFGGGPRQCIGNNFAKTEALLIISLIAHDFQLELVPGAQVRPAPMATLRPRPGVPMVIKPL
jgi:cytochrome P450